MITVDELKRVKIFSRLDETELIRLAQKAADVRLAPGEWLIREGELPWFFVLFEGRLQKVKDLLGRQQDIHEYGYQVGDFFGAVPILLGTRALVSLRAETPCRVARFDRQQLQNLIPDSKTISAMRRTKTLRRYLARFSNFRGFAMTDYHPYSWYCCSNQRCRMFTALPEGMLGSSSAYLAGQTTEVETVALACSHCNCVCSCTPIGIYAENPGQTSSKTPHMSYVKLWLRCGHPKCKSLTRLLVYANSETSKEELKGIVADKRVVGVTCCLGHPITRAVAA